MNNNGWLLFLVLIGIFFAIAFGVAMNPPPQYKTIEPVVIIVPSYRPFSREEAAEHIGEICIHEKGSRAILTGVVSEEILADLRKRHKLDYRDEHFIYILDGIIDADYFMAEWKFQNGESCGMKLERISE